MSLNTKTITGAAYERIKADIMSGEYKPGQHLLEKELSEQLEVSRTPIRDALVRLQEEGLLVSKPHRGVFVRELTEKDIQDYYQTRAVLEGLGAKLAARVVVKKNEEDLKEMLSEMTKVLAENKEDQQIISINNEFHDYIFQLAGNEVLNKMRKTLASPIALIRATSWINDDRKLEVLREHERIIHEIIEKNPIKAQEAAEVHIYNAWESAVTNLRKLPNMEGEK
ncbi:GntR family transcriptional regulator [Virgibacillus sp. NKC19-16]|uniref:GntR family transcriptional regulator n=1 Tax=Virgibacillus salidurans TaxID=2831673 RepID=UPI001F3C3CC4|nr:GntR family transcriptional regulator [Virgibacillus sp. NKC19-16]UJL45561.1 GntR family transcriptional regulator [Virgibacillus sp. NKC19-16]